MPRSGLGVMSWPAGTAAISNDPISSTYYNAFLADLLADLNAARPVSAGGTGGTTAATARAALDLEPGVDVQAYSATLALLAAVSTTSYGRAFLALADEATFKAYVNLEAADLLTAVKTVDGSGSGLDADVLRGTTPGTGGLAVLDDADAAAVRSTLGIVAYDVYTGSDAANTSFPIGTLLTVTNAGTINRCASATVRLSSPDSQFYTTGGAASALSGTWRQRGCSSSDAVYQFQRVA